MGEQDCQIKLKERKADRCNRLVKTTLMVWESMEYNREVASGRALDRPQNILGTIWGLTVLIHQPELTVPSNPPCSHKPHHPPFFVCKFSTLLEMFALGYLCCLFLSFPSLSFFFFLLTLPFLLLLGTVATFPPGLFGDVTPFLRSIHSGYLLELSATKK